MAGRVAPLLASRLQLAELRLVRACINVTLWFRPYGESALMLGRFLVEELMGIAVLNRILRTGMTLGWTVRKWVEVLSE